MIICFRPGYLGTKPNALTRQLDVYHKEGSSDYTIVNPHNFYPIFTNEQLISSLHASTLIFPTLQAAIVVDLQSLNNDILAALPLDPTYMSFLKSNNLTILTTEPANTPAQSKWKLSSKDFLLLNGRIYISDSTNLCLHILQAKHDHILSGHLGQKKTLELIHRDYDWLGLYPLIKEYYSLYITCSHSKPHRYKLYSMLQQLSIPTHPWDSISMDFIEHLPSSDGYDAILVIVNHFSKQGIFIPTHDTCTAKQLAHLFLINVFSKHSVPKHVTCDRGSEFISHFFHSLGEALSM